MAFPTVSMGTNTKSVDDTPFPVSPGNALLKSLFARMIVLPEEWDEQPLPVRTELFEIDQPEAVIEVR